MELWPTIVWIRPDFPPTPAPLPWGLFLADARLGETTPIQICFGMTHQASPDKPGPLARPCDLLLPPVVATPVLLAPVAVGQVKWECRTLMSMCSWTPTIIYSRTGHCSIIFHYHYHLSLPLSYPSSPKFTSPAAMVAGRWVQALSEAGSA